MNEILAAKEIIKRIVENHDELSLANKEFFALHFYTKEKKKTIQAIVVLALKHQFVLLCILHDSFPSLNEDETWLLWAALANTIFVKALDDDETIEKVMQALPVTSQVSSSMIEKILSKSYDPNHLIPAYVHPDSLDYLMYSYNIPRWVIEMWNRHYGSSICLRLLASLKKKRQPVFMVNTGLLSSKEFLEKHKDDFKESYQEGLVRYIGKLPTRKIEAYQQGLILPLNEGLYSILKMIRLQVQDEILVMANQFSYLPLAISTHFSRNEILLATPSYFDVVDFRRAIALEKKENIEVAEASLSMLITYVSSLKDVVFALPPSSSFADIQARPDFFACFEQDNLDEYLRIQREYLEECARYVKEGGLLVYLVETANNKEGILQIRQFLSTHEEFSVLDQKQLLPLDKKESMCFFAILKKGGEAHD